MAVAIFAYNIHLRRVLISLNYKSFALYLDLKKKDKILKIIFITKFNPYIKLVIKKNNYNKGLDL